MKKWMLFLSLYASLCLLAACAAAGSGAPAPGGTPSEEPQTGGETTQPAVVTLRARVVDEDDGTLLLAKQDGGSGDVYTLSLADRTVTVNGEDFDPAEPGAFQVFPGMSMRGALVEVSYGGEIMESYPAQFGKDASVTVLPDGFDDRCALYLDVLEDLWEVDEGLNSDALTYVGVDLTQTSLSESERAAVAWAFAGEHGAEPVEGTFDELVEQGYISASPLMIDSSDSEPEEPTHYFYEWTDGCLFTIAEKENNEASVTFDAQKWRSSLGAYFFNDCSALRSADGHWGDYTVGSEAIS